MSQPAAVAFRPFSTRAVSWGIVMALGARIVWIWMLGAGLTGEISLSPRRPLYGDNTPMSGDTPAILQAIALSDAGRYEQSAGELADILKRSPSAIGHNGLGVALSHLGRNADALKEFGAAVKEDPKFADAYSNRADLRVQMGDAAGALSDYDKVVELAPKAPGELAYAFYGRAQIHASSPAGAKAAIQDLQSALDASSSDWGERARAENELFRLKRGGAASKGNQR